MLSSLILVACVLSADSNAQDMIKVFDASGDAKRFADAAHLPPLKGEQTEVRVWSQSALIGSVSGWVVTNSEIRIYSNSHDVNGSLEVDEEHVRLEKSIRDGRKASALLRQLSDLSDLDGKNMACGLDGVGLVIDGIVAGHHFSVYAVNPDFCQDSDAKRVSGAFAKLTNVRKGTP